MDLSSIRSKDPAGGNPGDQLAQNVPSGTPDLSEHFSQLLQGNGQLPQGKGQRLEAAADPFAIFTAPPTDKTPAELAPPADDHAYEQRDRDRDGYFDKPDYDAHRPDDPPDTDRGPDDHDAFGREQAENRGGPRAEATEKNQPRDDSMADTDQTSDDIEGAENSAPAADSEHEGEPTMEGVPTKTEAKGTNETGTEPPAADAATTPAPGGPGLDQASTVLSGLVSATGSPALPGHASTQAQESVTSGGPDKALETISGLSNSPVQTGLNGEQKAAPHSQAQNQTGAQNQSHATSQTNSTAPATAGNASPSTNGAPPLTGTATQNAAQAADLSNKIGPGNPVNVRVTVTDPATTVISRPASSLSSASVLGGESSSSTSGSAIFGENRGAEVRATVANGTPGQPTATGAVAAANGAVQNAAVTVTPGQGQQTTQQTTGQAALAPSVPTAGAGAGGPGRGAINANSAAQPLPASGDATATGNIVSSAETTLSQPAKAASQTANAQRPAAFKSAAADQVNVQIIKALKNGIERINIQLHPASLGRVDVQIEMSQDGRVTAVIMADNKDTLDLLQRDAKELERALQEAGLKTDSDSLSFNLRENGGQDEEFGQARSGAPEDETDANETAEESLDQILDRLIAGDFDASDDPISHIDIQV